MVKRSTWCSLLDQGVLGRLKRCRTESVLSLCPFRDTSDQNHLTMFSYQLNINHVPLIATMFISSEKIDLVQFVGRKCVNVEQTKNFTMMLSCPQRNNSDQTHLDVFVSFGQLYSANLTRTRNHGEEIDLMQFIGPTCVRQTKTLT